MRFSLVLSNGAGGSRDVRGFTGRCAGPVSAGALTVDVVRDRGELAGPDGSLAQLQWPAFEADRRSCLPSRFMGYDFGSGDSDFKRRFADESSLEADLFLARTTSTGLGLNIKRSSTKALQYAAKSAVTRYETAGRISMQRRT
jgi:hypothetical protein